MRLTRFAMMFVAACGLAEAACGSSASSGADTDAGGGDVAEAGGDAADGSAGDIADTASEAARDAAPLTLAATFGVTIPLPGIPTIAVYNEGTNRVYFGCVSQTKTSAGVAVVDDATNTVIATIPTVNPVTSVAANATTRMIYAAELDQIDVIDSTTDKITTMVTTPDQSPIAGLAVDEAHNRIYAVSTTDVAASLYVLDGVLNTLAAPTPILLSPIGVPAIAVDGTTQKVFVLGVDSNTEGLVLTVDGPSGVPVDIENTASRVSASASGVVSLGDGTAAILLLSPGVVKHLGHDDLSLPDGFTPTGVAGISVSGPSALVVGFGADRALRGYVVDPASDVLSPFSLPTGGDLAAGTIVEQVVPASAVLGYSELYLDLAPDATGTLPFGPAETIKVGLAVK
jgi:hypothetical protein